MTATITRTEGIEAIVTAPFTWLVLVLIVAAPLVCAWLDRRPVRDPYALPDDVQAARDELRAAAAKGRQMRSERGEIGGAAVFLIGAAILAVYFLAIAMASR